MVVFTVGAGARLERRHAARRRVGEADPLARIRLRTGRELTVIDVGNTGALVESATRLLPGTHVDTHVMTGAGRVLVRSRVTRARVSAVAAESLTYQAALAFQQAIDASPSGYLIPGPSASPQEDQGTGYPEPLRRPAPIDDERLSA